MTDPDHDDGRWDPHRGEFRDTVLAINFVADAGRQMLESSTSVSEVIERLRRFLPAVGLDGCSMDATLSSLILSYWQPGQAFPLTTMRELDVTSPRLELLSGTDALLDRVERGDTTLVDAVVELRELVDAPPQRARISQAALLVSVLGWVLFLNGTTAVTVVVALAATVVTFPVSRLVSRLRLPTTAATFLIAVLVAAIPNLLAAAGLSLRLGPAIVGALFIYLPGRAFVSSVIDGIANAPVSSLARAIEALLTAGFLALGMLVGNRIGTGFGLDYEPNLNSTPLALSIIAAGVGVLGIAVAWSMPRVFLLPTIVISSAGWLIVAITTRGGFGDGSDWWAYLIAAAVVAVLASAATVWQNSSASVYTGVAILPLVPGFSLYTAMLAIAQGDTSAAVSPLADAGSISLAIAVGIAVGLSVSRNAIAVGRRVRSAD